jgi:nucleotide-binding universal stress UspA family protein
MVPTDFSGNAMGALRHALGYARQFRARVTLVHVVEPMVYPPDAGLIPINPAQIVEASKQRLAGYARVHVPRALLQGTVVAYGNPPQEIAAQAERMRADLIVISTHGYTGLKHMVLGSTAERVVRHAHAPVLVIRPDQVEEAKH